MGKRRGRGEGSIEELPSGTWRATLSLGRDARGKRVRRTFTGPTKKDVLHQLRKAQAERDAGRLADPGKLTVSELLLQWLTACVTSVEPTTYRRYEASVRLRIDPQIGGLPLRSLTVAHVERMYADLASEGVSNSEISRAGQHLSQALRYAVRHRLLSHNVAADAKRPKAGKQDFTALTRPECARLFEATAGDRMAALWVLAVDTGARPGELLALQWSDVDLDAGRVRIVKSLEEHKGRLRVKETKTPKGNRTIAISRLSIRSLQNHGREGDESALVFRDTKGGHLRKPNLLRRDFRPALKAAGLPMIRMYDLRHTCATLLLEAGTNVKVVSERLGHASIQITLDHYAKVLPGMQEQAAERIDDLFPS